MAARKKQITVSKQTTTTSRIAKPDPTKEAGAATKRPQPAIKAVKSHKNGLLNLQRTPPDMIAGKRLNLQNLFAA